MPPVGQNPNRQGGNNPGLLLLFLLLCSVPLQLMLTSQKQGSESASAKPISLSRLKRYLASWYEWYSDLEEWLDEVLPPVDMDMLADFDEEEDEGGGPIQFQLDLGQGMTLTNLTEEWFGSSRKARRTRPKNVKFRVGEVVLQNFLNMHCAIIGWDKVLKAPDIWIDMTYGEDYLEYLEEPHYTLVCDMREAETAADEFQYSAQREMEFPILEENDARKRILSTYLESFFEGFDDRSGRYRPRPWLRRMYPRD